jgi:predicted acylesterase/phospholipase RssA
MTIKHLVISGGGPTGFLTYGVASHLAKKDFWKLEDIKSIYGCSIGAYMGVVFSLGYEWEWLDDYFIKRPWEKLAASSAIKFTDINDKKCLINEHFQTEAILPLLKAKDFDETITLKELYEYNKIDIHLYATNINTIKLQKIDISHTTHPDLLLITALQMTMAFPIIFQPIINEDKCYVDGGLLNHFPLNDCINQQQCNPDEILAFKNILNNVNQCIDESSSIFDFMLILMKKMQSSLDGEVDQIEVKHIMSCLIDDLSGFDKWADALHSEETRRNIIENGYNQAELFMSSISNKVEIEVEASEVEASEVEASEVEAEASEVDASEVEASEVEASEVDASEVEASEVEVEASEVEVEASEVEVELEASEVEVEVED